jgi:hypothetical protein
LGHSALRDDLGWLGTWPDIGATGGDGARAVDEAVRLGLDDAASRRGGAWSRMWLS